MGKIRCFAGSIVQKYVQPQSRVRSFIFYREALLGLIRSALRCAIHELRYRDTLGTSDRSSWLPCHTVPGVHVYRSHIYI
jgi:hypothetical protein